MVEKVNARGLPLISIIMPCFNGELHIQQAIESIISQDYSNIELFIKDGGSTDKTVKIIKEYAEKYPDIIKWVSQKDEGQTDAINFGLKKTTGEIIAYLNADDIYNPGAFKSINNYFRDNRSKMWVIGKCEIIDGNGKVIRELITTYKNFWLNKYSYQTLLVLNYVSQMSVFWRRDAMQKVGLFDPKQYYVMDYDYWLRLGKYYTPGLIPQNLARFRVVNSSKSSTGFITQFNDEYKVAKKYTKNKFLLNLHLLHIKMVTSVYQLMKFVGNL